MLIFYSAEACVVYEGSSGTITKAEDSISSEEELLEEYPLVQQVSLQSWRGMNPRLRGIVLVDDEPYAPGGDPRKRRYH